MAKNKTEQRSETLFCGGACAHTKLMAGKKNAFQAVV